MSLHKVSAALVNAYQSVPLSLPTSYEGMKFEAPMDGTYAVVNNLPASLDPVTLGDDGEDSYVGFFQVTLHQPRNLGTRWLLDQAWVLVSAFQPGTMLWYQSQPVRIRRSVPSSIRPDGGDNVITVSIYWSARFARNGSVAIPPPGGDTTPGYGAGGGGGQQDFEFIQNTPITPWIINHNLGRKVTTDVYSSGGVKVWVDVVNISDNQVQINFDVPFAGYAILN